MFSPKRCAAAVFFCVFLFLYAVFRICTIRSVSASGGEVPVRIAVAAENGPARSEYSSTPAALSKERGDSESLLAEMSVPRTLPVSSAVTVLAESVPFVAESFSEFVVGPRFPDIPFVESLGVCGEREYFLVSGGRRNGSVWKMEVRDTYVSGDELVFLSVLKFFYRGTEGETNPFFIVSVERRFSRGRRPILRMSEYGQ